MEGIDALVEQYSPSKEAIEAVRSVRTVFLVGISGAGKDTIKQRLLTTGHYHDIVSHTTREPRVNRGKLEKDGVEYHFVSMKVMLEMLKNHELIEANRYSNNIYATSISEFKQACHEERVAITDVDINGVDAFEEIAPDTVLPIFLVPPDYKTWCNRWKLRYGDDYVNHMDDFERRKRTAINELRHVLKQPYYLYVVNDDIAQATREVEEIAKKGSQEADATKKGRDVVQTILHEMEQSGTHF